MGIRGWQKAMDGCIERLKTLRGKYRPLLVGLTGGIAGGKTTVANMLMALGSPAIDFDVLARQVVEPGKPAWKEIVDYFGKQVLQKDGHLDRKILSKIVFRNMEKRKRLESFTHPHIFEEFENQVTKIADKDPDSIIQVVMPLLIESNLEYLFHRVVVVYVPEEKQIQRLVQRDRISKQEAANILRAQLPIDEKAGHADFIINNEDSVEETRRQVEDLWQTLKDLQKEMARRNNNE